jgi:hypothetical protein
MGGMQAVSDEEMRRRLPKPPPKLWARPRGEVIAWLREVAEQGGTAGLRFAFDARNWPGTPAQRVNDAWSAYHQLMAETAEREKAEAERANEALRDKARKRAAAEKKRSGWAKWGDSPS